MESIFYFLRDHFPVLFSYKYFFVFAGSAIEGFNVQILSGFLIGVGGLKLLPTFLATVAGQFVNGFMWYGIGYFAGAKPLDFWVRRHKRGRQILEKVNEYFAKHSGKALISTRITVSFTVATLITAGSLKYDLKKFSLYNFIGGTCWAIITLGFGYFFGEGFKYIFKYVANATMLLLGLVLIGFALYLIFKLMNRIFEKVLVFNEKVKVLGDKMMIGIDKLLSDEGDNQTDKR